MEQINPLYNNHYFRPRNQNSYPIDPTLNIPRAATAPFLLYEHDEMDTPPREDTTSTPLLTESSSSPLLSSSIIDSSSSSSIASPTGSAPANSPTLLTESQMKLMSRVMSECLARRKAQKDAVADFLDRDLIHLKKLSHEKFKHLILFLHKRLQRFSSDRLFTIYASNALEILHIKRIAFYKTNMFPICNRALQELGITTDDLLDGPYAQWIPTSKEEIDEIVSLIFRCPLFAWDFAKDGCYTRADLIIQILLALGVPPDMLSKQYIMTDPDIQLNQDTLPWRYHVAASIRLPNGKRWILDPLLSSDKALTLTEWCLKPIHSFPTMAIINYGRLAPNHFNLYFEDASTGEDFGIVLFSTSIHTQLDEIETHDDHYQVKLTHRKASFHPTLQSIALLREKLEMKWIKRLADPHIKKDSLDWLQIPAPLILQQDSQTSATFKTPTACTTTPTASAVVCTTPTAIEAPTAPTVLQASPSRRVKHLHRLKHPHHLKYLHRLKYPHRPKRFQKHAHLIKHPHR